MDHEAPRPKPLQGLGHGGEPLRAKDPEDVGVRPGGVGEGPEEVEDGAHAELGPHRGHVAHGGVEDPGEEEAETQLLYGLSHPLGGGLQVHPQGLEEVRAPRP